ncbi:OmpA family protein [Tepidimonas taiwanensis]|uniref:OmpA family protein n=1 Tax=Tepidimonas taiwanensis TaxID=307486 RepID=UPI00073472B9|nr:OmpA family protein [Tepidimonas taiwanensis]
MVNWFDQGFRGRRAAAGIALAAALAATGCANMSEEQKSGTARGAMIGAAAGAVLGAVTDGSKGAVRGAAIGAGAGALGGYVWSSRMEQQKREMEAATAGTGVAVTQTADNRLKLEIPSDISFDVGRADIKPNFRAVLDTFAQGLQRNPAARVTIIGHTDSTGSDAINNPLSINRAAAVRDYLVARGVAIGRIAIDGRGSREPIASNDTAEGRARNRRVEIFVAEQAS